jgi:hypothetical protein
VTPPQGFFFSADISREQYAAWIASLPEIRLYKLRTRGDANNFLPSVGGNMVAPPMFLCSGDDDALFGFAWGDPLDLANVTRRQAVLIEDGVTIELRIDGARSQDVETFYIPRPAEPTVYAGGFFGSGFVFAPDDIPFDYVATIRRLGVNWWNVARYGREPVNALPQVVAQRGEDALGMFFGRAVDNFFFTIGDNDKDIYESWRLAARGRVPEQGPPGSFFDHSRIGMDPFTAEVTIDASRPLGDAPFFFGQAWSNRFLLLNDPMILEPAKRAIAASKAARDKILIDSETLPPTVGNAPTIDDLVLA